ncbi:MAG: FAD-binding oxidoreductase [Alphaproteobacteria bacterium]|nr:FAD-binding oxidoreductase [Alphaproteobacteria bacterium]
MPEIFDVIIIGAGIAGASVAANLAATHKVIILEREEFAGFHATGRSAALFSEIYGNSTVRALTRASRNFFYEPPQGFSEHPLVCPRGSLFIARQDQLAQLACFADQNDVNGWVRAIDASEALQLCPILRADYVAAALLETGAADMDVAAIHQGYLRQMRSAGGTLLTNAEVLELTRSDGQWCARTREASFRAPVLVNAAGAWADLIAAKAGIRPLGIQPCRRTALLVDTPSGIMASGFPMVIDIEETFYFKPDAGLLLLSPADESPMEPCDVQPEELDVAIAVDRVQHATTLTIPRIRKRWAGLRSFAPDRTPVVGFDPLREGFFWLAGQGGYGIQTAPAAGALAAALIRDDLPDELITLPIEALSPGRKELGGDGSNRRNT